VTELNLPPAELDVMSCIWRGIGAAADIRQALAKSRPMAHASVCTLLKRLEDKGLVRREKGAAGKAYIYQARVAPSGPRRSMVVGLLDRLFGGNGVALVASLLETRPPSDAELEELEALLKELRTQRARRPRVGRLKAKGSKKP
jgi:predicted transcriptional regulator